MEKKLSSRHDATFWFHLLITVLAWVGPFLFSWPLMVGAYFVIVLQFAVFDRCLLNARHGLSTETDPNATFYTYLFEEVGIRLPRRPLKLFVRIFLYPLLGLFAWWWQAGLGYAPLLF
jgi:hypothetical protein